MILDLKDSYGPVFLRGACCLAPEESWVHENHLHSSSFSWVNPLALTQLPLCIGPSDTISICCNYGDPHPLLAQPHKHTHTKHTAHWCNSCCLGGHGRLWVGSINVMVHTHKCSHTHSQPHHRWGPPYLPSPTEGHPAANEDTQTLPTLSTTLA